MRPSPHTFFEACLTGSICTPFSDKIGKKRFKKTIKNLRMAVSQGQYGPSVQQKLLCKVSPRLCSCDRTCTQGHYPLWACCAPPVWCTAAMPPTRHIEHYPSRAYSEIWSIYYTRVVNVKEHSCQRARLIIYYTRVVNWVILQIYYTRVVNVENVAVRGCFKQFTTRVWSQLTTRVQ